LTQHLVHPFIDDSGDTSVLTEKAGVSEFFVITAILVADQDLMEVREMAEALRSKFFQTGEIKSNSVGNNEARRITILKAINQLDVMSLSFAVQKSELNKEGGLAFKRSFFKRLNQSFYQRICRGVERVAILADEHGGEEFIEGFKAYVDRTVPPDLFSRRTFNFVKSQDEVMIGVADFIAGTLRRCFTADSLTEQTDEILGLVVERSVGVETWPGRVMPTPKQAMEPSDQGIHDAHIRQHCINSVEMYLEENPITETSDENEIARSLVLKYLLFTEKFGDQHEFVTTSAILEHLEQTARIQMSEHKFRSVVISKLRDTGVIIASGTSGYKIPVCESDIRSFVAHANTIILPMMDRLARARTDLKMHSKNELDILGLAEFDQLRAMAEAVPVRKTRL